jgi:hypothetical protein
MKGSVSWDIAPYSPLNVNRSFGRTGCLHLQAGVKQVTRRALRLIFNGLHGAISQKTKSFITNAVRNSTITHINVTSVF